MNNNPAVIYNGGTVIDVSMLNAITIQKNGSSGYHLVFELQSKVGYFLHPQTNTWQREIITDKIMVPYKDWDMAKAYLQEWADAWLYYKDNLTVG